MSGPKYAGGKIVVSTIEGTVAVSGGGGGVQYPVSSTAIGATGTGTLVVGVQEGATTVRGMAITTTGGLIIGSMPAVGGGVQYAVDATAIAATGTGTLVIGVQEGATITKGLALTTTGGLIIGSMPAVGGGVQYAVTSTALNTGTGTLVIGIQEGATIGRGLALHTTGGLIVATMPTLTTSPSGTQDVAVVAFTPGGTQDVSVVNTPTVTVSTLPSVTVSAITTGTISGTVTVIPSGTQNVAITGEPIDINFSKILGEDPLVGEGVSGTGVQRVTIANNGSGRLQLVATVSTVSAIVSMPVLSATNVTIASITTGTISGSISVINTPTVTVSTMPVISATGVTIASITTGTISGSISVINTPTITVSNLPPAYSVGTTGLVATGTGFLCLGIQSGGTTGRGIALTTSGQQLTTISTGTCDVRPITSTVMVGGLFATHHASRWDAFAISTTSGASTILKTSGAHTLYITDLMFSVDVPMTVVWNSATTAKGTVYLATKGGFAFALSTPMVLNSAQSLTFSPSASGSCAGFAAGWTVT